MTGTELDAVFQEYDRLAAQADQLFNRVREQYPAEVACKSGCSECCHAAFDLSLVEAMALNRAFNREFDFGIRRSAVLQAASDADRQLTRLKHHYFKQAQQGVSDEEIFTEAAKERVRCPLLGLDDTCLLYEHRPITCRLYGVPTVIHGKAHVCGQCHFQKGASYPTVALDRIQDRLADMSRRIGAVVGSRFRELHRVYVPVSMALTTKYDDAYLGVGAAPREQL
ncbi:YkgJ family cysteine cluster protein [uncultured Mailhella sp.]|uniref:YkgJ family cysteine cluster protein n=1 Tax=uncultured Mailhella sp. TaxID=1981031 RepID=UPI002618742E|nr:YkgJ family cysteine cluster protein [uncultured Mailhella sp.]